MKNLWMLLLPFLFSACQAQTNDPKESRNPDKDVIDNKPKVEVKVNKEYDENGNIIRYDSVYVWSYTNSAGDSSFVDIDSLMLQFRPFMQDHFPSGFPYFENDWLTPDSLFYHQFPGPDYFNDRWESEMEQMQRIIREMDSLKEWFFNEHYPGLMYDEHQK